MGAGVSKKTAGRSMEAAGPPCGPPARTQLCLSPSSRSLSVFFPKAKGIPNKATVDLQKDKGKEKAPGKGRQFKLTAVCKPKARPTHVCELVCTRTPR